MHYDLRLQFSESSTLSFAIPYGLPGNYNSKRPNRMAIETRVHNLWNHLIESASHATGSLLIWDTGEYEVVPKQQKHVRSTDDEDSESDHDAELRPHCDRLREGFQRRSFRLRLHGTRLPPCYTIGMRSLSTDDPNTQPRKRRKRESSKKVRPRALSTDESEDSSARVDSGVDTSSTEASARASDDEELDESIRVNNAYPGADNTIGSVHQRYWFVTLDKLNSGLCRETDRRGLWSGSWKPFIVRGRDHERSIITGRLADEVMADDGVTGFVGRKMWRPIVE